MAKNDFPWLRVQVASARCSVLCALNRSALLRPLAGFAEQRLLGPYESQLHGRLPEQVNKGVVFLACDEEYFAKFGKYLVRSALSHLDDYCVHLHVYALSDSYKAELKALVAEVAPGHFSFTYDHIPYKHLVGAERWYYLASVRFIRIYQLLRSTRKPVFCLDADSLVAGDLRDFEQVLSEHDAAIFLRLGNTLAWRKVLAAVLWISPTDNGIAFARDTALTIAWLLRSRLPYHIDQLVLHKVYQYYQRRVPGFRVLPLDNHMLSWDCDPESVVWSPKGDRKYNETTFLLAQQKIQADASVVKPGL